MAAALQCEICGGKLIGKPGWKLFADKHHKEIETRPAEIELALGKLQ